MINLLKYISILFIMFILSACTGSISGLIIDESSQPVSGAIISTDPPTNSVMSTENGYVIKDIPAGAYKVTAKKIGYLENSVDVSVTGRKVTSCDIQIEKEIIQE